MGGGGGRPPEVRGREVQGMKTRRGWEPRAMMLPAREGEAEGREGSRTDEERLEGGGTKQGSSSSWRSPGHRCAAIA